MNSRYLLPIGYLVATVAIVAVAVSPDTVSATAQIKTSPMTSQKLNTDPRYIAADLPLLPMGVDRAVRPLVVMRATYEFAARHPEVMHYVPCFCGCGQMGHKDNHDCFVSARNSTNKVLGWETHALVCEICVDVAYHGNTQRLVEISPYKFNGPGGAGQRAELRLGARDEQRHRGGNLR